MDLFNRRKCSQMAMMAILLGAMGCTIYSEGTNSEHLCGNTTNPPTKVPSSAVSAASLSITGTVSNVLTSGTLVSDTNSPYSLGFTVRPGYHWDGGITLPFFVDGGFDNTDGGCKYADGSVVNCPLGQKIDGGSVALDGGFVDSGEMFVGTMVTGSSTTTEMFTPFPLITQRDYASASTIAVNLPSGTSIDWRIIDCNPDCKDAIDAHGTVKTAPEVGTPGKYVVDFESCMNPTIYPRTQPTWTYLLNQNPDLSIQLGDNHYGNIEAPYYHRYLFAIQRNVPEYKQFIASVRSAGLWDDHEFSHVSNGRGAQLTASQLDMTLRGFNEAFPYPVHTSTGTGIWRVTDLGDVTFFIADGRTPASADSMANDDPNKTMFGATQWFEFDQWIRYHVKPDGQPFAFYVLVSGSTTFLGGTDSWKVFYYDRKRLVDYTNVREGFFMVAGDIHSSGVNIMHLEGLGALDPVSAYTNHVWAEVISSGIEVGYGGGAGGYPLPGSPAMIITDGADPRCGLHPVSVINFDTTVPDAGDGVDAAVYDPKAVVHSYVLTEHCVGGKPLDGGCSGTYDGGCQGSWLDGSFSWDAYSANLNKEPNLIRQYDDGGCTLPMDAGGGFLKNCGDGGWADAGSNKYYQLIADGGYTITRSMLTRPDAGVSD